MDKEKVIWGAIAAFLVVCSGYLVFGKIRPDDQLGFNNLQASSDISGSGTANQIAFFDGTTSIAGDTAFTVNAGTDTMTVTNLTVSGTCTGCGGGGGTGLQMLNSMTTGQIVFAMNTSSGATLAGFTLATSTSALYLPTDYTLYATNTQTVGTTSTWVGFTTASGTTANLVNLSLAYGTSTGVFAWSSASGTLTNLFNLNVSGTIDTAVGANLTCGGQNCKKTITLSAAGCNEPTISGSATSSLDYYGNNVYRVSYFQPLTFNRCQLDWLPPNSWDGGTISVHFLYAVTTTDANGVTWGLRAGGVGPGSLLSFSLGATGTVTTVATTTNAITATTNTTVTVGGVTSQPELVKLEVSRSNVGASTNTASFLGAVIEYGVNKLTD